MRLASYLAALPRIKRSSRETPSSDASRRREKFDQRRVKDLVALSRRFQRPVALPFAYSPVEWARQESNLQVACEIVRLALIGNVESGRGGEQVCCKELDLNQRPSAYDADAQPTELSLLVCSVWLVALGAGPWSRTRIVLVDHPRMLPRRERVLRSVSDYESGGPHGPWSGMFRSFRVRGLVCSQLAWTASALSVRRHPLTRTTGVEPACACETGASGTI